MIYTTISLILMRREEGITVPVDIITFIAENAIMYYVHAKVALVFTYFTLNCKLYLNIGIVFAVNMYKLKILKAIKLP